MALPDGVCKYDGVGAGGRHKGSKHPSDFGPGKGNQSKRVGGSIPAVKASAPKGKDAGGRDNLGSKPNVLYETKSVVVPPRKSMLPGGVDVGDGVSVPKRVKK